MKKILFLASAVLCMGLTSCSVNDTENVTELSTENFPATSTDADAVLAGIYMGLNSLHANPQCSYLYYAALSSDDQLGGGGTNDKLMQALDLITNYGNDMTNVFYEDRYTYINRANTLIAAIPNLSLTDDEKAAMDGEAKFLRAYFYYELASMYGGNIVLRTEPGADALEPSTPSQVWGQILQDLYDASTNMPSVRKTDGHVDKYCAEAMLARAWLFYTGMYCNGETLADLTSTNYNPLTSVELPNGETLTKSQVIDCIDDCVNNSGYSLVPDFRNQWAYTNRLTVEDYDYTKGQGLVWVENDMSSTANTNPESMFATKFNKLASWSTTIGYSNGFALHFGMRGGRSDETTFPFGQGWGAGPVAPNLVADWQSTEPNDMRLKATVLDVDDELGDKGFVYGGGGDWVQETGYYAKKWSPIEAIDYDGVVGENTQGTIVYCFETIMYGVEGGLSGGYGNNLQLDNIHDLVLIRFADVLLMQSELKEDATGMNRVRARAGLSEKSYSLANIQNERRWELACEGIRWNDIRRWHIAAAALAKQQDTKIWVSGSETTNNAHNGGYVARYNATAGFQKIPETQLNYGLTQNEGYTASDSEYQGW